MYGLKTAGKDSVHDNARESLGRLQSTNREEGYRMFLNISYAFLENLNLMKISHCLVKYGIL